MLLIMNLTLLFSSLSLTDFAVKFVTNEEFYQDMFIFNGFSETLHLSRANQTLSLIHTQGESYNLFQLNTTMKFWGYSWPMQINDEKMRHILGENKLKISQYDMFTLINAFPIYQLPSCPVYASESLKYEEIVAILASLMLLLKFPALIQFMKSRVPSNQETIV